MAKRKSKVLGTDGEAVSKKKKKKQIQEELDTGATDPMSQCALLCQEQRWREAAQIFQSVCKKAANANNKDLLAGLTAARLKVEYSLRRQMATTLTQGAKRLLAKEFLLDVGE
jgi:hypothetical protein